MKKSLFNFILFAVFSFALIGCDGEEQIPTKYGIFNIIDDNTVEMDGDITSSTLSDFNSMIVDYPELHTINMKNVPGSSDDDINLQVSLLVYNRNIATHIMDNGEIASGGTDFFLAGTTRTQGQNTKIGVHSWSTGTQEATDFPVGDAEHQKYIDYYVSIGFSQTDAEAFYYYTINAAAANDIHWMTEAEIEEYKVLTP
jgi:hypothetical protein